MTKPSAILCDFDGTLVDSLPVLRRVYETFIGNRARSATLPEFGQVAGMPIPKCLEELTRIAQWPDPLSALVAEYEASVARAFLSVEARPGAMEFLRSTKAVGIKRAIVSSAKEQLIRDWLRSNASLDLVDVVVGRDSTRRSKPHPEPYLRGMDALGCGPRECIALEDSAGGVASAQLARVPTYFVGTGTQPPGTYSFRGFEQLLQDLGVT